MNTFQTVDNGNFTSTVYGLHNDPNHQFNSNKLFLPAQSSIGLYKSIDSKSVKGNTISELKQIKSSQSLLKMKNERKSVA